MSSSRKELQEWIEGHRRANERERATRIRMTADEKLSRISRLMASAGLFDMSRRSTGDRLVRELWQRLRSRWPPPE